MIAESIAEYLKQNGIKQTFICEKTGLTRHCISTALNGKRRLSVDEYERICLALDVPYSFFFNAAQDADKTKTPPKGSV